MAESQNGLMEKLVALCKRRGFIWQSSEIYGGLNGFWDYGPLGVELKRNVKQAWWEDVVRRRDDIVGLDSSIIMNPKVWQASGHLSGFNDPMVECKNCRTRTREDFLVQIALFEYPGEPHDADYHELADWTENRKPDHVFRSSLGKHLSKQLPLLRRRTGDKKAKFKTTRETGVMSGDLVWAQVHNKWHFAFFGLERTIEAGELCPFCGEGKLTAARKFNLMFPTYVGAMQDSSAKAYLRPETAQGIFCNFKNVLDTQRLKLPFGIAQIGKSFRNEINPRNYTFRSREFEQMEIEFFCHPDEADAWYTHWRDLRYQWYVMHGLTSSKLRLRDHDPDELAHYARACADVEYEFPFGISELEGIANRTDFDLKAHQGESGRDMTYFDDDLWTRDAEKFSAEKFGGDKKAAKAAAAEAKQGLPYRFTPYVIEPSGGVDRATLAFLCEAYTEDEQPDEKGDMQQRVVMKLHPRLAPTKVAVFPLVRKEGMPERAIQIHEAFRAAGVASFYDEKGAVGRRYRRQDEAGTPFCITVDGQTMEDGTVTVRDRDSLSQDRVAADKVLEFVRERI